MLITRTCAVAGVLLAIAATCHPALAQPPAAPGGPIRPPHPRPTTSPYLNLLNDGGQGPALNYYRRVRPEIEFRAANAQLARSIGRLRDEVSDVERGLQDGRREMSPTGHAATFMNYGSYFPNQRR